MTTPWSVPREWVGETAAVLASGPSMTREQAEAVRGKCRVIAVSNQGIDTLDSVTRHVTPAFAPWADVLYSADQKWWKHYREQALKFKGYKVTVTAQRAFDDLLALKRSEDHKWFDPRPTHLCYGGNSGYQAVHLAAHFGVKRIILLGFDMKNGRGGRKHWFGNHPAKLNSAPVYSGWIRAFDRFAVVLKDLGIEVINCSPDSALRCFRRSPLGNVLNGL